MTFHNPGLARLVPDGNYDAADLDRIRAELTRPSSANIANDSTTSISGAADPDDATVRPHVRFDGLTLSEIGDKRWAHSQNDALGYFLRLSSTLAATGALRPDAEVAGC